MPKLKLKMASAQLQLSYIQEGAEWAKDVLVVLIERLEKHDAAWPADAATTFTKCVVSFGVSDWWAAQLHSDAGSELDFTGIP